MSADIIEVHFPTLPEVLERTGLSYRQLDYWTRVGYLRPARDAHGSGSRRGWTEQELQVATVMRRLVDAGLDVTVAANVAREWAMPGRRARRRIALAPGITVMIRRLP